MADTITTYQSALKETYTNETVRELLYKDNPLFKLVSKDTGFVGLDYYRTPVWIAPSGAVSSSFSNAQAGAAATASAVKEFRVTRVKSYGLNRIDDDVVLASEGKVGAFLKASQVYVESALYRLGRDLSIAMFRNGYGTRGKISTGGTSTTITLTNPNDATNFEVGDRLDANTTEGDAAKARGSSGNPLIVTGCDPDAGTLTFGFAVNDATNGIPTIANGDFLYLAGDAVLNTRTKLVGLAGWLPTTAPGGSDSFFGLNRSINPNKLAGVRVSASALNIIEALNNGAVQVSKYGGKVSHFFMSYGTYQNLINSLEGKVRIVDHKDQDVGFPAIEVITPKGKAMVIADINCPDNIVYGLQLDTWKMVTMGAYNYQIGSDFGDGLSMTRVSDADQWELRYRFSGGLTCFAPGWNCVISLS